MGRRAEAGRPPEAAARAVISQDGDAADLLGRAGLWDLIGALPTPAPRILLLVDLAGAGPGDPSVVEPPLVEALVDLIHDRTGARIDLAASADSSSLWASNRDVYALADLLGYRFETPGGLRYDIVDLGEGLREEVFAPGSALAGSGLSGDWIDADLRIVLARLRSDEAEGFAGALAALLGALPAADKDLHYRQLRNPGAAVAALIDARPPDFAIVDGRTIAHGASAARIALPGGPIIASASPLLADLAAALKLGTDPYRSRIVAEVAVAHPPPVRHVFDGDLDPIAGVELPSPLQQRSLLAREASPGLDRVLPAWLNPLDSELFPRLRPLDARMSAIAAAAGGGDSPTGEAVRRWLDLAAAAMAQASHSWNTLFDKDALTRQVVPLDFDPGTLAEAEFEEMIDELDSLVPVARSAPEASPGLRWRRVDGAVLFAYARRFAIPFDLFVGAVDVARTIASMNDYLGGVIVPVEHDSQGRPTRQVERNLYLPQPNYLTLYQGQPIDVTKIEAARYDADEQRLYWKTIRSRNGSAEADDGLVVFARSGSGTEVTIYGKQKFTLPPFWKLFDISLIPALETGLTTHAYRTFFDRTMSNFEALVEGRDIRIGHDPALAAEHPAAALEKTLTGLMERAEPFLARLRRPGDRPIPDSDGFVHVEPDA
jgi:uncharacterized protein (DUF362 family)